jgi:hypothetical protein
MTLAVVILRWLSPHGIVVSEGDGRVCKDGGRNGPHDAQEPRAALPLDRARVVRLARGCAMPEGGRYLHAANDATGARRCPTPRVLCESDGCLWHKE